MSIYSGTQADDLDRCLKSLSQQTLPAAEIVLVRDGPIVPHVESCLKQYESTLPFHYLSFSKNRGLGPALRDGLEACGHELVGRVDSDDWSVPKRFQLQTQVFQENPEISVVGGWLKEGYRRRHKVISVVRHSPLDYSSIHYTAKRRNPINHPTVMFKKSHVLACGSYEPCPFFEDYYLWAKMLVQGYILNNLPEILVETDVGLDYFSRRGGLAYIKNEIHLIRKLRRIGFLSPLEASVFTLTRLPIRLAPVSMRQYLYRRLLRST